MAETQDTDRDPTKPAAVAATSTTSPPPPVGHEGFVQPSSYLRPRAQSRPMTPAQPLSAVDRDQRYGVVSQCIS